MKSAELVIDLAFGDGGKGVLTDNLCARSPNKSVLVVRFSGGHNAGHTVIRDGVKHVFSSFGAGTLNGRPSFFTEDTAFYLPNMFVEWEILKAKGINPRLTIHPLASMTTPYDVAWNRMTERRNRHGSCGAGIAATMKRNIETPHKLYAVDLLNHSMLKEKLAGINGYYQRLLEQSDLSYVKYAAFGKLLEPELDKFLDVLGEWQAMFSIGDIPTHYPHYVFEGSQGIMLDMDHGVFPNVTYANTTSKNALKYCERLGLQTEIFYVTRCYLTRHGSGWMPNENKPNLINNEEEINVFNEWQTDFRTGELDYGLLNQAIAIDKAYHKKQFRTNLVVGCVDQRPDFLFDKERVQGIGGYWINNSAKAGNLH